MFLCYIKIEDNHMTAFVCMQLFEILKKFG